MTSDLASNIQWGQTGQSSVEASGTAVRELCYQFEKCPMQQVAFDALVGELLRPSFKWVDKLGEPLNTSLPELPELPVGVEIAVVAAIKGMLVAGMFFWRKGTAKDLYSLVVAHPTEMWHGRTRRTAWTQGILFDPYPCHHKLDRVNSPCGRAAQPSVMLAEHERLLLNRDRLNSKPGVFISVDSRLQNNDGHSRPWFRAVGREFVDSISEEMDATNTSLDNLVKDRSEVITSLGAATLKRRAESGPMESKDAEVDRAHKHHREHVVRDGFVPTPASSLHSLSDGHRQMVALENRILYAMCVPPVAVGRNVNSERMSSAPQLVMHSLRSYKTFVSRVRTLISCMLKAAYIDAKTGHYIAFAVHLDNYDLDRLESIMTPAAAANAYAATFDIPLSWLSEKALAARQGAMHGAQRTVAGEETAVKQAKKSRGPPPGSNDTA